MGICRIAGEYSNTLKSQAIDRPGLARQLELADTTHFKTNETLNSDFHQLTQRKFPTHVACGVEQGIPD